MVKITPTAKAIIINICIVWIVEAIAGFIILGGYGPGHVVGVSLGSFVSVIKILHLEWSINKTLSKGEKGAAYFQIQYFLRLIITAIPLLIGGFYSSQVNLLSVGLGLINMSFGSYLYKFFLKDDDKTNV